MPRLLGPCLFLCLCLPGRRRTLNLQAHRATGRCPQGCASRYALRVSLQLRISCRSCMACAAEIVMHVFTAQLCWSLRISPSSSSRPLTFMVTACNNSRLSVALARSSELDKHITGSLSSPVLRHCVQYVLQRRSSRRFLLCPVSSSC